MGNDESIKNVDLQNDLSNVWPKKIEEHWITLENEIPKFNTFQLLANITHYNHLHKVDDYTDIREDRMLVIPEIVSLFALRSNFVRDRQLDEKDYLQALRNIQDAATGYLMLTRVIQLHENNKTSQTTLTKITNKLMEDEMLVRNPGHPEHHKLFVGKLYSSLSDDLKKHFGFDIQDSLILRDKIVQLVNERYIKKVEVAKLQKETLRDEIVKFRNTKQRNAESTLLNDQILYFSSLKSKQLNKALDYHLLNKITYQLEDIHVFSPEELADYCNLTIEVTSSFLEQFSVTFPTEGISQIVAPDSILRRRPILQNEDKFMVASLSLLGWCVEPTFENYINSMPKLAAKYKDKKHDFLLDEGMSMFSGLLASAIIHPKNLYYTTENGDVCETDGLITYDRTLFIIEAKGHRLSQKAKNGNYERTEKHLKQLIRDSTEQGIRTKKFIETSSIATFRTSNGEITTIDSNDYDEYIIVSLTLEPIGHLTPLVKVGNDLGYFEKDVFPWIISIYDLIVIRDFISHPILLLHYLKRRKSFLLHESIHIYEETDMLAYFLSNGLYFDNTISKMEKVGSNWLSFENNTDIFNDYYMYTFGKSSKLRTKPKFYLPDEFMDLIMAIDCSKIQHKNIMLLEALSISPSASRTLMDYIRKVREQYYKDGQIHDCSILTNDGKLGITYMAGPDRGELDMSIYTYCRYKYDNMKPNTWIGFGDVSPSVTGYNIMCAIIIKDELPKPY
ncbi:hypothetical protein FA048_15090 [Pedobacter polaris]|uniref:NERD domain-containing protein n=1 Tax=Pedobacter polaris TaxID=2571273 RepID=A0A4U1CGW8_9SPHI|nr:hypothetical protein [Pedobacter polaris]TKC06535.1 hypothetical protein FA048_15090 [Pedobacter polaris]